MSDSSLDIKELHDGIAFKVRIQPRSSRNMIAGIMGDAIKINLTSPPVDGEANAACTTFIAGLLNVPKSTVSIIHGQKNRLKIIKIAGIDKNKFLTAMSAYI
ncbi:hypothetical protein SCACP_18300 [Sporomusa carbonis]|uniref:DUF167 domain-containing protein n=1 Tax=Sporomusa carbonis TaxID=3076075 RepID=UPI003A737C67